jgi:hypothetical protein
MPASQVSTCKRVCVEASRFVGSPGHSTVKTSVNNALHTTLADLQALRNSPDKSCEQPRYKLRKAALLSLSAREIDGSAPHESTYCFSVEDVIDGDQA